MENYKQKLDELVSSRENLFLSKKVLKHILRIVTDEKIATQISSKIIPLINKAAIRFVGKILEDAMKFKGWDPSYRLNEKHVLYVIKNMGFD